MEKQIIENCQHHHVVVSLLDLHQSSSENDQSSSASSTLNQTTVVELIKKFKEQLNSPLEIPFSHKMNLLSQIKKDKHAELSSSFNSCYDVLVIHDRNLIIFVSGNSLFLFSLDFKQFVKTIKLLTSEPHEMELDGNHLYFSTGSRCFKYDLNLLLKGDSNEAVDEKALLWSSPESILSNSWGLALLEMNLKKYVFVMDYGSGIHVFDSETGQPVRMNLPTIRNGYGIAFTPEKEMIISTSNKSVGPVQIYTYSQEGNSWILSREAQQDSIFNTPYGICYEKRTGLIYLVDTFAYFVFVFRSDDMELVQKLKIEGDIYNKTVYGIYLDSKRGELYLPICDFGVAILN